MVGNEHEPMRRAKGKSIKIAEKSKKSFATLDRREFHILSLMELTTVTDRNNQKNQRRLNNEVLVL
jgi:hypothetical protein